MRITIIGILLAVSSVAAAIPNPESVASELRARGDIVARFKVLEVSHGQKGDVLYTSANVEILEVTRGDIEPGAVAKIAYGENYIAVKRWWEEQEKKKLVGSVPPEVVPRLRKGQIATGWFKRAPDGELLPAAGSFSFEIESIPQFVEFSPDDEIVLRPDQYAFITGQGVELWLNRFELVSTCPEDMQCIRDGDWLPVISLVADGKYAEVQFLDSSTVAVEGSDLRFRLLPTWTESAVIIRMVRP